MRGSRLFGLVAMVITCAAALSGCVSIPDSSGVNAAGSVGIEDAARPIRNVVFGPTKGDTPEQIVSGFYAAMLAYPQTSDTARLFLTPAAASKWSPDTSITVYSSLDVAATNDRASIHLVSIGRLDTRGSWRSSPAGGASLQTNLRLVKIDGEWRIADPPDGAFVSEDFFVRFYDQFSLYFFDPTRTSLVPDPVYLQIGDTTATALVRDLLQGPTRSLKGAVVSAVPADTELQTAVSVSSSGLAVVPLSSQVLKVSADDRQLFAAQLAWTLRQVPGIERIAINVEGQDLPIENTGTVFDADSFAGYDPAGLAGERGLYALSEKGLVSVDLKGTAAVPGPIGTVLGGRSMAVQVSGQLAAVISGDGSSVKVGSLQPEADTTGVATWFSGGAGLLRPSWDAIGVLWLVDQTSHGAAIYAVTGKHVHYVPAPGLDGQNIREFAVSRDGVRFAAIVQHGTRFVLEMATIQRDARNPTEATIRRPEVIENPTVSLSRLRDIAWVSPTSVAILASESAGQQQPYEVAIDGSVAAPAGGYLPVLSPVSIAAGPNTDAPVAVGTADGDVYVQTVDLQWVRVQSELKLFAPAYPG